MKVLGAAFKKLAKKGFIQFVVGVLVGSSVMYLHENRHTLLVLTNADIRELKVNPGCAVYSTVHGPIYVGMNDFSEGE